MNTLKNLIIVQEGRADHHAFYLLADPTRRIFATHGVDEKDRLTAVIRKVSTDKLLALPDLDSNDDEYVTVVDRAVAEELHKLPAGILHVMGDRNPIETEDGVYLSTDLRQGLILGHLRRDHMFEGWLIQTPYFSSENQVSANGLHYVYLDGEMIRVIYMPAGTQIIHLGVSKTWCWELAGRTQKNQKWAEHLVTYANSGFSDPIEPFLSIGRPYQRQGKTLPGGKTKREQAIEAIVDLAKLGYLGQSVGNYFFSHAGSGEFCIHLPGSVGKIREILPRLALRCPDFLIEALATILSPYLPFGYERTDKETAMPHGFGRNKALLVSQFETGPMSIKHDIPGFVNDYRALSAHEIMAVCKRTTTRLVDAGMESPKAQDLVNKIRKIGDDFRSKDIRPAKRR